MPYSLVAEYTFEAAHTAPCGEEPRDSVLHGHTYKLRLVLQGSGLNKSRYVVDFRVLSRLVKQCVLNKLDHSNLNDLMKITSAEEIARWVWLQLKPQLPQLKEVFIRTGDLFEASYFEEEAV